MRLMIALFISCFLIGCVSTDVRYLDERTAIISARGTAYDTHASVIQETIKQAAHATRDRGYYYFQIVDARDATRTSTYKEPDTVYTHGTVIGQSDAWGNVTGTVTSTSRVSPGHTWTYIKPGAEVMVRMYKADEIDPSTENLWDAFRILMEAGEFFKK